MQHGAPHVLRFLFVHGLATVLLFGGLGVRNQQIELHEVPNFTLVFIGVGSQMNSTDQIQEQAMFQDDKFKVILLRFLLTFYTKSFEIVSYMFVQVCAKFWALY